MREAWSLYSGKVLNHFGHPRNVGVIKDADGVGYVGDSSWGIGMELYIKVEDGIIVDAKFRTFGCGASIATSSVITEIIKGRGIKEAADISNHVIANALDGLPPSKTYCAVLGQELIKSAIDDYLEKSRGRDNGSK